MTKLQICKSFIYLFFFYFKYTKSEQTNLVKMNYLQEREEKKNCWSWSRNGVMCWFSEIKHMWAVTLKTGQRPTGWQAAGRNKWVLIRNVEWNNTIWGSGFSYCIFGTQVARCGCNGVEPEKLLVFCIFPKVYLRDLTVHIRSTTVAADATSPA